MGNPAKTAIPPTVPALLISEVSMQNSDGPQAGRARSRTLEWSLPLNMAIIPKMSLLTAGEAQNKQASLQVSGN